ncbi:MAG: OmpA family protein [Chitinophagales bacterium]
MKISSYPVSLLITYLFFFSSCLITKQTKTGETLFAEKQYTLAADLLKSEFNKESDPSLKAKKAFMIGECYRLSSETEPAEQWYKTSFDLNGESRAQYLYAQMLKSNEKYTEASATFSEYLKDSPFDDEARSEVEACNLAQQWKIAPSSITVTGVDALNSPAYDYAPVHYGKNGLVFTSDRSDAAGNNIYGWTGEKFSDLFTSTKDEKGNFSAPVAFSEALNSPFNEGAACFSKDFSECYFTRCGSNQTLNDYCKIYFTYRTDDSWSEPQVVPIFNDSTNVSQPFLTADGKELYISADVDGGYGGKDLYVLTKTAEGWGEPLNLGPNVNTTGDEAFPCLTDDGTLYFASNGQMGMGGLDLYMASRIKNQWGNIQNLKAPINSGADDLAIIFDKVNPKDQYKIKSQGYFVSNRPGGKGHDDIFHFTEEKVKVYLVSGDVVEKIFEIENNPNSRVTGFAPMDGIDVTINVMDEKGNTVPKTQQVLKADKNGAFRFKAEVEKIYRLTAAKTDYFSKSETANTIGFTSIDKDTVTATVRIVLDRIYKNVQVNLSNIYYDYNKANIREDAAKVLDTLLVLLNENPAVQVEIGSHTDSRGKDPYNLRLSQARAQSVVDYLVVKGIDPLRLTAKGYGETQPVNECVNGVKCTEEQFQENRRTTFKVLSDSFIIESTAPEEIIVDPK